MFTQLNKFDCDFQGRKINFTNSKTVVGFATDRDARDACLRFFSVYFPLFFVGVSFHFIFPVLSCTKRKTELVTPPFRRLEFVERCRDLRRPAIGSAAPLL